MSGLNCEYLIVDVARHVGLHKLEYLFFMTSPIVYIIFEGLRMYLVLAFDLIESKVVSFDFFALLLACDYFMS